MTPRTSQHCNPGFPRRKAGDRSHSGGAPPPADFFRHCRKASSAARACSGPPVRASREPRASAWAAGRSASEGGSGGRGRAGRPRQASRQAEHKHLRGHPAERRDAEEREDRLRGWPCAQHAIALHERHFPRRLAQPVDHPQRQGPPGGVDQCRVEQERAAGHHQHPALVGAGSLDDQRPAVAGQEHRLLGDLEGRVPRQCRPRGVDPPAPGAGEHLADLGGVRFRDLDREPVLVSGRLLRLRRQHAGRFLDLVANLTGLVAELLGTGPLGGRGVPGKPFENGGPVVAPAS